MNPTLSRATLWVALFSTVGCARERDPAPDDLDGLARYLFRNWEDAEAVYEGIGNLAPWLRDQGLSEEAQEGYLLSKLTEAEVADVQRPLSQPLSEAIGVGQTGTSSFSLEDHAPLMVRSDQTWNEPSTYEHYVRQVVEGDPDSFSSGHGMIRTFNDIEKSGAFGVTIPFEQNKDYRWVSHEEFGDSVVGRSWVEQSYCSENGKNCVMQSFSIDLFHQLDDGRSVRLIAGWTEVRTEVDALVTQDFLVQQMVDGNQDIMEATEEELSGG